ncbi:hypothetical protein BH24ACT4_BH24ACT4_24080 [soil metagenome]
MPVLRLDHVQLAMPSGEEEAAAAFYEGLLGLPRVPKPPHLEARGGCWFEKGDLSSTSGWKRTSARPARPTRP